MSMSRWACHSSRDEPLINVWWETFTQVWLPKECNFHLKIIPLWSCYFYSLHMGSEWETASIDLHLKVARSCEKKCMLFRKWHEKCRLDMLSQGIFSSENPSTEKMHQAKEASIMREQWSTFTCLHDHGQFKIFKFFFFSSTGWERTKQFENCGASVIAGQNIFYYWPRTSKGFEISEDQENFWIQFWFKLAVEVATRTRKKDLGAWFENWWMTQKNLVTSDLRWTFVVRFALNLWLWFRYKNPFLLDSKNSCIWTKF